MNINKTNIMQLGLVALISLAVLEANAALDDKYVWSENTGWFNFIPTHSTSTGIYGNDQMEGYVWAENIGWILLGSPSFAEGARGNIDYPNTNNTDWGVNYDSATGSFSGYAWSENVGWINFNPSGAGVTIDSMGEFSGYAWGENVGYISFNCQNMGVYSEYGVQLDASSPNDIDATKRYAWSENSGWFNFDDSNGSVKVYSDHLEGYVWAENIGWVMLGNIANGTPYGNNTSTDWGVNQDGTGKLSGYAWSENVGWINLNPLGAGVTIDPATGEFSGAAWAENVGYIYFNDFIPSNCNFLQTLPLTLVFLTNLEVNNQGGQITVQWGTAIEIDHAGFNIERREPDGAWIKINHKLIPAQGNDSRYSFADTTVQQGKTYEYRLVELDLEGNSYSHYPEEQATDVQSHISLVGPDNGVKLSRQSIPSFRWQSNSHDKYKFQWAFSGGTEIYEYPAKDEQWTSATNLNPSAEDWQAFVDWALLQEEVIVFWRVIGIGEDDNVIYSEVRQFEIIAE